MSYNRYIENNFLSPLFEKFRVFRRHKEQEEKQQYTSSKKDGNLLKEREHKMPNFISLDTETSGLDSNIHSILEIAGYAWEPEKNKKELLFSFLVNENDYDIVIDEEAMKINRINMDDVVSKGLRPTEVVQEIEKSLKKHYGNNHKPCVIMAQNAGFDLGFTRRLYRLAGAEIEKHFERRVFDVPGVLYWLMLMGDMKSQYPNFNNLLNETGVFLSPNMAHSAKADAGALADAMLVLYKRFKS